MRILNSVNRSFVNSPSRLGSVLGLSLVLPLLIAAGTKSGQEKPIAQLLNTTNLWSVHFKFSPDQWDAMPPEEPAGGMFGPGPGRGEGGRPGGPGAAPRGPGGSGPGGGGRGPGGPGGFGPGMFLAPTFMRAGDVNKDEKLSREEFASLAQKWYAEWDKKKTGVLKTDDLREGLNSVMMPPGGPGPGGPGGRPGGPGMIGLQGSEGKRNGLASAAGIEFKYVKGDLQVGETRLTNVAVRYKGNGTWMGSRFDKKRSMKVDLNEFVNGQKYGGVAKLNFHNCVTDASYMNEVLSYRLYRDAGVPASRTAYARVYVDVPGKHSDEYFGLYSVVENVDSAFAEAHFGTKKGAIFKPVTRQLFEYLGEDWAKYNQTYDPKTELSDSDKKRMIAFAKLVSEANDAEFTQKLGDYLDLDNFSRYMAVTTWLATLDSILGIGQNYYIYLHPKTGKLSFIPWDLDHSFGQFFLMGSPEQREKLSIEKPWQGENRFLERVFKNESFHKLYRARLEEFSKTIFQPNRFVEQVDQVAAAVRSAVKDESDSKLERFDKVVAGESVPPSFGPPPGGGGPGGSPSGPRFAGPGGFMQPSKPIKGFVKVRAESVKDQLSGKSKGEILDGGFGGPGGPRGFGPGNFMAPGFLAQLDTDKNDELSRDEFQKGFARWFESWDREKAGALTEEQLREGLNESFRPPGVGGPEGPVVVPLGRGAP